MRARIVSRARSSLSTMATLDVASFEFQFKPSDRYRYFSSLTSYRPQQIESDFNGAWISFR